MQDKHVAIRVRVTGRVQGVAYRAWTKSEAQRRGLSGWVRNEADGSVTSLIAGPEAHVDEMVQLLWDGPRFASVSNVTRESHDSTAPGAAAPGFRIL